MSRKLSYLGTVVATIAVIFLSEYILYQKIINKTEQMQTDYEKRVSELIEVDVTTQLEDKASEVARRIAESYGESVEANAGGDSLTESTVYQIQSYDAEKKTTATDYETLPQELIGYTREEAENYFKEYMEQLPAEEYLDGLQSISIASFSGDRLVVKKTYDSSKVKFRYYLIALDGEVIVYYGDKKTVYEYTGIETKNLSKEEKAMLKKGLEVKDEAELYSILENYSS